MHSFDSTNRESQQPKQPRFAGGVPIPDAAEGLAFLQAFDLNGRHNLVAIDPEKRSGPIGRTFSPGSWSEIGAFIEQHNGRRNLYFSVNEPASSAPNDKLSKADIGAVRAIWADVDPVPGLPFAEERLRLQGLADRQVRSLVPPSFVVDSGGGIQLFWQLQEKVALHEPAKDGNGSARLLWENIGVAVADAVGGGDHVQNIDRIMRLPGTVNIADAKKLAKGRPAQSTARILAETGRQYSAIDLAFEFPDSGSASRRVEETSETVSASVDDANSRIAAAEADYDEHVVFQASSYGNLSEELRAKFERACADSPILGALWRNGKATGADTSLSGLRFDLANELRRAGGFSVSEFGALLNVWPYAYREGESPEARDVCRAWGRSEVRPDPRLNASQWLSPIDTQSDSTGALFKTDTTAAKRKLRVLSLDEIEADADRAPSPVLVEGLLDAGTLSVLYGASNVGKTFVALDLAYAVAQGRTWAGAATTKTGVLYAASEGGNGIRNRVRALLKLYGRKPDDAAFRPIADTVDMFAADADLAALIDEARAAGGVGLIVIDTLARAFGSGDENSSKDMGAVVRNVDRLRAATGAHVMLVHHTGKDDSKGARGSSVLRAAVDTEIEIARDDATDQPAGEIVARKQRDLDGNWRRRFCLLPIQLPAGSDRFVTTCVAEVDEAKPTAAPAMTKAERDTLNAIDALSVSADDNLGGVLLSDLADELGVNSEALRKRLARMTRKGVVARRGDLWLAPKRASDLISPIGSPASHSPEALQTHKNPGQTTVVSQRYFCPDELGGLDSSGQEADKLKPIDHNGLRLAGQPRTSIGQGEHVARGQSGQAGHHPIGVSGCPRPSDSENSRWELEGIFG